MAKRMAGRPRTDEAAAIADKKQGTKPSSRSAPIAAKGIRTADDFKSLMSAQMSDLIEGRIDPRVGNAVCNTGGKLLKVVEMQFKYGRPRRLGQSPALMLVN